MSQQRQQVNPMASIYEDGTSNLNYDMLQQQHSQYLPQQNMYLQKQYNQQNQQAIQQSFLNEDSQQTSTGMLSGRFGNPSIPSSADSYRNLQSYGGGSGVQQLPQANQKQAYSQNILSQYQTGETTYQQLKDGPGLPATSQPAPGFNPLENSMKIQQQPQQMLYSTPAQQANLLQELMKLQAGQFHSTPQTPPQQPVQQQPPQQQQMFGQGFLNAASILATIQQQIPQSQPNLNFTLGEKQAQSVTSPNNLMALQQLLSINSNLSQYQSLIDQIEKQNVNPQSINGASTVSQGHQIIKSSAAANQSQIQSPTQYTNYSNNQSYYHQNSGGLNQSQSMQQQELSRKQQSYLEELAPAPQSQNYSYLLSQSKTQLASNDVVLSDQEIRGYGDPYDSTQKNTVSGPPPPIIATNKDRPSYNPSAYSYQQVNPADNSSLYTQQRVQPPNLYTKGYAEDNYEVMQRSPNGNNGKMFSNFNAGAPGSRRNEGSPKIAWLSGGGNKDYSYQNNNNTQKFSEGGQNSPLRQSANRAYANEIANYYGNPAQNQLDNSFNRNPTANFANPNGGGGPSQGYMNASQNSSQILQEHHLNSQTNQPFRGAPQGQNQYSPQGSSYRYDENLIDNSINFGKSQRMTTGHQQNQSTSQGQQPLNVDDIPIGGGRPKTFEELLEDNLRKMGQEVPEYNRNNMDGDEDADDRPQQKKEFLKRKSQKIVPAASQPKKYNYYVDNFDETKKKERSTSQAPVPERSTHSSGFMKQEDIQIYHKAAPVNHHHLENTPIHSSHPNRAVSPMDNYDRNSADQERQKKVQKKRFLTRGSGTAGGKQGHQNPPSTQKQKGGQKVNKKAPLLSDDEYPNDFNFAAEQDNKSPKLNHGLQQQQASYLSRQAAQANKKNLEGDLNRNSIAEFEKLEQECNNVQAPPTQPQRARSPLTGGSSTHQQQQLYQKPGGNKRRKKLFDDSDSNGSDDLDEIEEVQAHKDEEDKQPQSKLQEPTQIPKNASQNMSEVDDVPKSNVVKKFFYKEDPTKSQQRQPTSTSAPRPPPPSSHSAAAEDALQRAMTAKLDQLDKTIEAYNQQNEMAQKMKRDYEQMLQKQRVEFREFEGKKKREMEEIERIKNEEIEKVKKERKAIEQRQRNLQMVGASNKREREEIEGLKKELQRVQEEAKAKEAKMKAQIERQNKINEELKMVNKELSEELKHANEQIRQKSAIGAGIKEAAQSNQNLQQQQQQSRYTFSTNNNNTKSQEQIGAQQQQQQPKGILKNKEERPVSASQFYNPMHDAHDEEDDDHQEQEEGEEEDQDYRDERSSTHSDQHQVVAKKNEPNNTSQLSHHPPSNPTPPAIVEDETEEFDMRFPAQYHNKNPQNMKVVEQIIGHDGKIQRVYENGKKEVIFNNGVKREVFPDGYTIVFFNNNDIKQTYADQKVVYYFAEAKTTQTTFSDGLQVFKFANNQIEKHFPDGTKEIIFPDGTIKCIFADGEEESIFPDGTIQRIEKNGVKAIEFANGQKDILFPDGTRIREYPDGRVRKTYPDGTCENSYRQQ